MNNVKVISRNLEEVNGIIVRAMKDEQVKRLSISKSKTEIFIYDFGRSN